MRFYGLVFGLNLATFCFVNPLSADEGVEFVEWTAPQQHCACSCPIATEDCHCPAASEGVCCGCTERRAQPSDTLTIHLVVPRGSKLGAGNDKTTRMQTADDMNRLIGERAIAEDGSIELGKFGHVQVAGLTVEEARQAIAWKLTEAGPFASVEVRLDLNETSLPTTFAVLPFGDGEDGWKAAPIKPYEPRTNAEGPWDFVTALESHEVSDEAEIQPPAPDEVKQVSYTINVFEDRTNCMTEFAPFRDRQPVMFAESGTMLPALAVLRKHDLIRTVSAPKLICNTGERATADFGGETSPGSAESWEGVKIGVSAIEREKGLQIELSVDATENQTHSKVETSVNIPTGQTVILSTRGKRVEDESGSDPRRPIYVVLTPEIVK